MCLLEGTNHVIIAQNTTDSWGFAPHLKWGGLISPTDLLPFAASGVGGVLSPRLQQEKERIVQKAEWKGKWKKGKKIIITCK